MPVGRHALVRGLVGLVSVMVLFFVVTLLLIAVIADGQGRRDSGARIGVIILDGVISSELSERAVRQLTKHGEDPTIRAVVLRIDSPGGGVASSQEIYEEVKRLRASGKLVVASLGSVAASGGYYIASAADYIFANAGTLTGSIGVIVQLANAEELLRKIGITSTAITSAPFKDSGNPTRPLHPEEKRIFQALVDDVHQQFVEAVSQGRQLSLDEVKHVADGRIYTGRQAKDLRLIDELGTFQDAVTYVASTTGMEGKPTLVQEGKDRLWWLKFFFERLPGSSLVQSISRSDAILQYRWPY
jgi:protease-4